MCLSCLSGEGGKFGGRFNGAGLWAESAHARKQAAIDADRLWDKQMDSVRSDSRLSRLLVTFWPIVPAATSQQDMNDVMWFIRRGCVSWKVSQRRVYEWSASRGRGLFSSYEGDQKSAVELSSAIWRLCKIWNFIITLN